MKKFLLYTSAVCLFPTMLAAQNVMNNVTIQDDMPNNSEPTIIYGAAENASGGMNVDVVEQAADAQNPLGNPIVAPESSQNQPDSVNVTAQTPQNQAEGTTSASQALDTPQIKPIEQESEQGILQPGELALPQPSTKIENELYQSGNDIIDVQAYPIDDVSTVTEPNLQPTIVAQ